MVIEVPRAPPFASIKVPAVEAFTPAAMDEVAVRFGTLTVAVPELPLCVKVSMLVGFGATDWITF